MTTSARASALTGILLILAAASPALAGEQPIGDPVEANGMQVGAVYLQAVTMDPQNAMCGPADADIHLEADIHALAHNPNGFAKGEWIPYLSIRYTLTKPGSSFRDEGPLVPMVADDGPHYGRNVKLAGPGKYHVSFEILPPSAQGFYRHTDKETGVGQWWAPMTTQWDFVFIGSTGKKGGY